MITQDQLFRYNGVNSHGNRISGVTNVPSLEAAREELERYYETVQVFPAGLGERPAEMWAGGKRVSFAGDTTMKFACDAMPCEGMIINKIGSYLIFEGMAADSGSYFVHNPSISDTRRFDSRADAEDWAREIAMDVDLRRREVVERKIDELRAKEKAGTLTQTEKNALNHFRNELIKTYGSTAMGNDASEEDLKAFHDFEHGHKVDPNAKKEKPKKKPTSFREFEHGTKPGEDAEMATDPPVSEAQRKAMGAAKSGHSTLGIPSSVGKEFIDADPGGKLPKKAKDAY